MSHLGPEVLRFRPVRKVTLIPPMFLPLRQPRRRLNRLNPNSDLHLQSSIILSISLLSNPPRPSLLPTAPRSTISTTSPLPCPSPLAHQPHLLHPINKKIPLLQIPPLMPPPPPNYLHLSISPNLPVAHLSRKENSPPSPSTATSPPCTPT